MYFPTGTAVISKLSIVIPSHLLLNVDIVEVFSLVKTLVKKSFNIVAFFMPSVTISPLSTTTFSTDSPVVFVSEWT